MSAHGYCLYVMKRHMIYVHSTLQYYDYCKNYINKVVALNKNRKPFHIFTQGKYLETVMDRVSKRSGIQITLSKYCV